MPSPLAPGPAVLTMVAYAPDEEKPPVVSFDETQSLPFVVAQHFEASSPPGWNAPDRRSAIRVQQGSLTGITSSTPVVRVAVPVAALVRPSVPTA
jgi:hypothetical protein